MYVFFLVNIEKANVDLKTMVYVLSFRSAPHPEPSPETNSEKKQEMQKLKMEDKWLELNCKVVNMMEDSFS